MNETSHEQPATDGASADARPSVDEITELLRELSFAISRQHHWLASQLALHDTDLAALMVVHDLTNDVEGRPSIGRVGELLDLSSPATTAVVDRLVAAGHVERVRDPDDRRRVLLRATSGSYGAVAPLLQDYLARLERVLSSFAEDELAVVRRFVSAVLGAVATSLDDPGR